MHFINGFPFNLFTISDLFINYLAKKRSMEHAIYYEYNVDRPGLGPSWPDNNQKRKTKLVRLGIWKYEATRTYCKCLRQFIPLSISIKHWHLNIQRHAGKKQTHYLNFVPCRRFAVLPEAIHRFLHLRNSVSCGSVHWNNVSVSMMN